MSQRGVDKPFVFISYRRSDSLHMAHLLRYALEGSGWPVFVDTARIDTGDNFRQRIDEQFDSVSLLLLLVGGDFRSDRLASIQDPIGFELRRARFRRIPVVPVLIDDAEPSSLEQLPPDLRWVFQTHAKRVRNETLIADVDALIAAVPHLASKPLPPFRVLWVDDQPANNEAPRRELRELQPILFEIAVSTDEALEAIRMQSRVDLIVTDRGRRHSSDMSETAGVTLIEKLGRAGPPIIVYTSPGYARRYREEMLNMGAFGVTGDPAKLISLVLEALNCAPLDSGEADR